jgi:hypothetical protein
LQSHFEVVALRSLSNDDGPPSPAATPLPNNRLELPSSPHSPEQNPIVERANCTRTGSGEGGTPPNDLLADGLEIDRVTVLTGSSILDGTIDPLLAYNEYSEEPLQLPMVEPLGLIDDQPYLRAHSSITDHMEAVTLDLGECRTRTPILCCSDDL